MKHLEKTKTTISHFKNWLKNWDLLVNNYDDREQYKIQTEKLEACISFINKFLSDSDDKVMKNKKTNEEMVKAMFENQSKSVYKQFNFISKYLVTLIYEIEKMRDLNHRKTSEIFKLKAEIAKLRECKK